jgi:hypothetical protein
MRKLLIILLLLISCKPMLQPERLGTMAVSALKAPVEVFLTAEPAKDVVLAWDDTDNPPATLKGYRLYIYKAGCTDFVLEKTIDIPGGVTRSYTISKFKDTYSQKTHALDLTAVALDGRESEHSNRVDYIN